MHLCMISFFLSIDWWCFFLYLALCSAVYHDGYEVLLNFIISGAKPWFTPLTIVVGTME
jgi:hypothetical protein